MTFGGGSRTCIGITFAQLELKALSAHVAHACTLEHVPGQQPIHAGLWVAKVPFGIRMRIMQRQLQDFATGQ